MASFHDIAIVDPFATSTAEPPVQNAMLSALSSTHSVQSHSQTRPISIVDLQLTDEQVEKELVREQPYVFLGRGTLFCVVTQST